MDEQSKREIKDILMQYDRTLLVADPRRCEPKKYAPSQATLACLACLGLFALARRCLHATQPDRLCNPALCCIVAKLASASLEQVEGVGMSTSHEQLSSTSISRPDLQKVSRITH